MSEIFRIILVFIISILIVSSSLSIYYSLNIKREYRFLHYKHIWVLVIDIFLMLGIYLIIYIGSLFNNNILSFYNSISFDMIFSLILSIYLLYKSIYKIYYILYEDKIISSDFDNLPKHYYYKDSKYYLVSNYITLSNVFKKTIIIIVIVLAFLIGFFDYVYNISYKDILSIMGSFVLILLLLLELYVYFDGMLEDEFLKNKSIKRKSNILWDQLDKEYHRLWKKQLIASYNVFNKYDLKIIEGTSKIDDVSMNVTKGISDNKTKDFVYSKILSPIITGKNIIIESCFLEIFSNIIIPIINILFTANKKIMILTDSYSSVEKCAEWLEKLDIINSNIVVDVLSYEDNALIKLDNKVDIYVGTVDLALNSRAVCENIDVVFCLNIDKMIMENALNLNLLASFLSSDLNNNVQYVMFGNRVNGLIQTISQVFMKNNFEYQTIENGLEKQINVNFWKTEGDWFQTEVLGGIVSNNLGQLIPLSLPAFKYGVEKVNVVSAIQSLKDQLMSLQTIKQSLKKYINKDIINIDDAICISQNDNFIQLDNNSVVIVEDNYNNVALVLLNYLKYTNTNMYLNVVTSPYMLRDYIIANMDFFINNVEVIGSILPVSKTNIKLSLYRIINQLCYRYVSEDMLLDELKKIDRGKKIDIFENDQERFITESLEKLIKDIFGVNIYLKSYLDKGKYSKRKGFQEKHYYKLLETVKDELPERLFKNITFIDSEQSAKILKRLPVFELYQNYLEGQYVSFDGKYYLIDRIDYDNGIVNLSYSNNTENVHYRQCREINNINHLGIFKEFPLLRVRDSILKKTILCADLEVNTNGYYIFNNEISFVSGGFGYNSVDNNKKGLCRKYSSTNILKVNICNDMISKMNEIDQFKLSFTFSLLLNEIFETLFANIKQYILVRCVVKNEDVYKKYSNEELLKLYKPIIDENVSEGINIYITEDTELEKGITDTIIDNFDTIIIRLLYDYLYWLVKEDTTFNEDKWYQSDGDYINFSKIDKLSFLKYGNDKLYEYIDLDGVFNCLNELIINGNNRLTNSRLDFINNRCIDDSFKMSLMTTGFKDDADKKIGDSNIKDKTFIKRVKEFFRNRKKNVKIEDNDKKKRNNFKVKQDKKKTIKSK